MQTHIKQRDCPVGDQLAGSEISPLMQRVYANRGITDAAQLVLSLKNLHSPYTLKGIDQAVKLLIEALDAKQRIIVVGDYDADGATSTALAVRALRHLEADVDYIVPSRFEFGYGLTPEIVDICAHQSAQLIITVDNGISSIAGAQLARALGIKLLITDHHLPAAELPSAEAIVNPNQAGDEFPSKSLAGVGVMFYLLGALRAKLRELDWFDEHNIEPLDIVQWLDIVALGTVADVVALDQNNRILVEQGLRRIRAGKASEGLKALLTVAGIDHARVLASDLGFQLGPRINAAGRLEDMSIGVECLLTNDSMIAANIADSLHELNITRREIESEMHEQALQSLAKLETNQITESPEPGLCVYQSGWHQGVVGILASRLKEKYWRPTIAFADVDEQEIKGSARSIPGLHIRDVLAMVASQYPGLIIKFGGHAMAAGLSLQQKNYQVFKSAFNQVLTRWLDGQDLQTQILSDGELMDEQLNLTVAHEIRNAGPWGQGFTVPVFDGRFKVLDQRIVGHKHLKLSLQAGYGDSILDAILFNYANFDWQTRAETVHIAYQLDVNYFRGVETPQLIIKHLQVIAMH